RPRRVVDEDRGRVAGHLGDSGPHRVGARRAAGHAGGHLRRAQLLGEQDRRLLPAGRRHQHDRVDPLRSVEAAQRLGEQRKLAEPGKRLRLVVAEPLSPPGGDENGPRAHQTVAAVFFFAAAGLTAVAFGAAAVFLAAGLALPWLVRTSSSHSKVSSSPMFFAYMSSEARIFFALTYICFSPVERPFSPSRSARFRTTSASSKMSPVFILSRLCLKRRFQFLGISVPPEVRYLRTFLTASSSITFRRPTSSAFSAGTFTVMSLWSILIVRYSRVSPSTSFFSRLTTVPAPWCGYTTLSPTLYKPSPLY